MGALKGDGVEVTRGRCRRLVRFSLLTLGVTVAVISLFLAILQTPFGHRATDRFISRVLSSDGTRTVRVEGVSGRFPFLVRVARITVADSGGAWLCIEGGRLAWKPVALWRRRLDVEELTVERVMVRRPPEPGMDKRARRPDPRRGLWVRTVVVRRLGVESLRVGSGAWTEGEVTLGAVRIDGRRLWAEAGGEFDFTLGPGLVQGKGSGRFGVVDPVGEGAFALALSADDRAQSVELEVWGEHAGMAGLGASQAVARVSVQDVWGPCRVQTAVSVRDFRMGSGRVDELALTVEGTARRLEFLVVAEGDWGSRFGLDAAGAVTWSNAVMILSLDRLSGLYDKTPMALTQPFVVRRDAPSWTTSELAVDLAGGRLALRGEWMPDTLMVTGRVSDISLSALPLPGAGRMDGRVNGSLRLVGPRQHPEGEAEIHVETLTVTGPAQADSVTADVRATAGLRDGRCIARVDVRGRAEDFLSGRIECGASVELGPHGWGASWDGRPQVDVRSSLDLAMLAAVLAPSDDRLSGKLTMALGYDGAAVTNRVTGGCRIESGAYENLLTGLLIRDLQGELVPDGDGWRLEGVTASDGEGGRFSATGQVRYLAVQGLTFGTTVRLSEVRLVRRADLTASGSGEVHCIGSRQEAAIRGRVDVATATLLVDQLWRPLPEVLEFREKQATDAPEKPSPGRPASPPPPWLRWNLDVAVADLLYIRGRGLDSVWQADIRLESDREGARLTGFMEPKRGVFTFFGRPFQIREGRVLFPGGPSQSPSVNLTAEYRRADFVAMLQIVGRFPAPEIRLTSDPPYPSDEILARILFGRSAASISPAQAVTLGLAARSLLGEGGGLDFIERAQRRLGVDQIDVRETGGEFNQTELAVGRYVSPRLYLEASRAVGARSGGWRVEYEVTPKLSLETDAGTSMRQGIRLNWKNDY